MATFGNTTIEASTGELSGSILGLVATSGAAGSIASITAYLTPTGTRNVVFGLYDASDDSLVGTTNTGSISSGAGWYTLTFASPVSVSAASSYYIVGNADGSFQCSIARASATSAGRYAAKTYDGTLPDPSATTNNNFRYSIYATYSADYSDTIADLGADHHWQLSANSNDGIGSANGTDTGIVYTGTAIAEDATNSARMDARGDRISIPTTTTINNSAQARKAVGGWFMVDALELPHCRIYGEGDATTNFQFLVLAGNSVVLEVRDGATWQQQIYSDVALQPDRAYHLCAVLEGSGYGNEVRFYIDGVEQTSAIPSDRQPDDASLALRGVAEFGDPAGTVGLNGVALTMQSPGDNRSTEQVINAYYQHWFAFGDEADAVLTDTEVREELFERGALPDVTISSGTESAMQTSLDTYADTVRGDAPLCIRISTVTGDGDLTLDLDNITFDSAASIHVQYMGTGTLTLRNTNGSDASIVSTPSGGTITIVNEANLSITGLTAGSEVRVYDAFGTGATEIGGIESSSTSFSLDTTEPSVDIVIHDEDYSYLSFEGVDMTAGDVSIPVTQFTDRVYLNP